MNTTSMTAWSNGATSIRALIILLVSIGDGFHEVHVNTMEAFWLLLRSSLRPHRGISQEKSPCYLAFFEFVHNVRRRGKALLHSLLAIFIAP
jgi:hypothetical protein